MRKTDWQIVENAVKKARDEMMDLCRNIDGGFVLPGFGVVEHRDNRGLLIAADPFVNKITTAGDQYYAKMGMVGVSPAAPVAPTLVNGMKLGTSAGAETKSGVGSFITTYISGSNNPFDSTYPQAAAVGGDTGWNITYKTTWGAGDSTNATINEVTVVTDQGSDTAGSAANSISRAVISTVNKASGDTLAITWNHKFLGA